MGKRHIHCQFKFSPFESNNNFRLRKDYQQIIFCIDNDRFHNVLVVLWDIFQHQRKIELRGFVRLSIRADISQAVQLNPQRTIAHRSRQRPNTQRDIDTALMMMALAAFARYHLNTSTGAS